MAPSPSLVFVQTDNGVRAYRVYSGMVVPDLRPETLAHLDVTDNQERLRECLTSMTVEGVMETIDRLGMAIRVKKPLKKPLIESFLGQWEKLKARAVEVGQATSQMLASSSQSYPDATPKLFEGSAHCIGGDEVLLETKDKKDETEKQEVKQKMQLPEITVLTLNSRGELTNAGIGFGSEGFDVIGLNKAFEGSKVLNIIKKGDDKDMRFTYHYKIGETFGELNDKMRESLISMDCDVTFMMNDSYIEYWQTISSTCDDTRNTVYVTSKLMGGAKCVKKQEKLAINRLRCAEKVASKPVSMLIGDAEKLKYNAIHDKLMNDPQCIPQLVQQMTADDATEVVKMIDDGKVKSNTLNLIIAKIVPNYAELKEKRDYYTHILESISLSFNLAMTNLCYSEDKNKFQFDVIRDLAKTQKITEEQRLKYGGKGTAKGSAEMQD